MDTAGEFDNMHATAVTEAGGTKGYINADSYANIGYKDRRELILNTKVDSTTHVGPGGSKRVDACIQFPHGDVQSHFSQERHNF
jgi:hypothetical protein